MALAIRENRKTQTRRPVKPQPPNSKWEISQLMCTTDRDIKKHEGKYHWTLVSDDRLSILNDQDIFFSSPFGSPGDIIVVRESVKVTGWLPTSREIELTYDDGQTWTGLLPHRINWEPVYGHRFPNGAFKEACRLKLKVKRVWVERVQEISKEDAIAEGIPPFEVIQGKVITWACKDGLASFNPVCSLEDLWNSIYPGSWDRNDWVWASEFEVVK
jgi:hypothetical protein